MIPTPDQMSQIDKEEEQKKAIKVKSKASSEKLNIVRIDDEESSSPSSMSLYNIESNEKHSKVSSRRTPTMIECWDWEGGWISVDLFLILT